MSISETLIRKSGIIEGPLDHSYLSSAELCRDEHGALASFVGVVRNEHFDKGVTHLFYECYTPMAEKVLHDLILETAEKFDPALQAVVYHGVGTMNPSEVSVVIHVSSGHRVAAFDACRHIIERIKEDLPVWKHEFYTDGTDTWLKGS